MCRIERFGIIYPDGTRERREQVVHCRRGTHSQPCRHNEVVVLGDRLALASDLRPPMQPRIVPIEPRDFESSRIRPSSREKPRGPTEGMALNFKFWNPFSSKNKEKKEKTQYYIVRRTKKPEPRPAIIQHQPPIPPPPETHFVTPVRGESPVVIPIQPPDHYIPHHNQNPEREPRRRRRPHPVVIHRSSEEEEDEDESPSPPEANREHGRRTRSLSPISRYEAEKEIIRQIELRQRELRQRERQERVQREEREARERAENLERLERQREREEQIDRQERLGQERRETRQRQRLAVEREARRQQEEREREQLRILQEQEDRERLRAADRARRHQEEEDNERRRAADRDRFRRLRDEQARRQYAEPQRYPRARQANIPRPPRHPVFVHQHEGPLDRGERFIQHAIRAENLRQFERRAGRPHGRYDDEGLRRRNTIDGGWYGRQWRRDRR